MILMLILIQVLLLIQSSCQIEGLKSYFTNTIRWKVKIFNSYVDWESIIMIIFFRNWFIKMVLLRCNYIQLIDCWKYIYKNHVETTPERSYPYVAQLCGTTILAFFAWNTTPTINNINAILTARLEIDRISNYVCFLSVSKEYRSTERSWNKMTPWIYQNQLMPSNNSRVTLHVNTENTSALSLYLTCGMRCIDFLPYYYFHDRLYATSDVFFMALQLMFLSKNKYFINKNVHKYRSDDLLLI